MAVRISIHSIADAARAETLRAMLSERFPNARLTDASFVSVYTVDAVLNEKARARAALALANETTDTYSWTRILAPNRFAYAIEVGFLPGVTDNAGRTVSEMLEDAFSRKLRPGEGVYSSWFLFLSGRMTRSDVDAFAGELHNSLIERAQVFSFSTFRGGRVPSVIPKVTLAQAPRPQTISLSLSDDELMQLSRGGIKNEDGTGRGPLALSLAELKAIRGHFSKQGRLPTDIELESLAQTWSEHCKHTIFNDPLDDISEGIYKRYIKGATERIRKAKGKRDFCVSVFKDNSGGIVFNDDYLVTHKVETHNSPSALDPYGGAITGIVGVNRDTLGFGLGAKPIANVYGFCVAEPSDTRTFFRDKQGTAPLLSSRRILSGVVRGVNAGGNQSGIPTPLGFVYTDASYRGKPLVFAGTVGLIPRKSGTRRLHQKAARAGDYIVMIGGRVGKDGIHGATFSSEALEAGSPATAVQIGDPITQKKLSDAIVRELRDKHLYSSITDNGAGGLSCSVAEMARECGGCRVELLNVPLKYSGLAPWEIWISESQERMTLAVPKKKWTMLKRILDVHDVEATRIGEFTASGSCVVTLSGKKIMDVPLSFLHDGRPKGRLVSQKSIRKARMMPARRPGARDALLALLASPNIGSVAFISDQYDHEVQGTSVTKPLQGRGRVNADAAILRPILDDVRGLVLSHGYCPSYAPLDTYQMAAGAIDMAVRNAVCSGASLEHLAILDNFCWSSSYEPERLYELKEAARACYDTAIAYGTPFISGKDSMFNDFRGYDAKGNPVHIAALPTLLVSTIGVMKDVRKTMTLNLKGEGDVMYLLGTTREEFGGSEYAALVYDAKTANRNTMIYHSEADPTFGKVPVVDAKKNLKVYRALEKAINKRLVSAALGLSRGGLACSAAKMAIAGGRGMELSLSGKLDTMLFSESQGRVLVSVPKEKRQVFEVLMKNVTCKKIGVVTKEPALTLRCKSRKPIRATLKELTRAYRKPFKTFEV